MYWSREFLNVQFAEELETTYARNLMVAYLMFDNVGVATLFLRFYEWYIASVALSTELLGEYTYRLTYQQERTCVAQWYPLCYLLVSRFPF